MVQGQKHERWQLPERHFVSEPVFVPAPPTESAERQAAEDGGYVMALARAWVASSAA